MKYKSASELKRYELLKMRLQRDNLKKPENRRASRKQIEDYSRDAVSRGIVNEEGHIIEVSDDFSPK